MKNPTTSFLNAVFTGELGLAISRFSACSGKQLLNISGRFLWAGCPVIQPAVSEHSPQPGKMTSWPHPFLIYHQIPEGRSIGSELRSLYPVSMKDIWQKLP